ncbi:MAG TPA: MarR family transcriptional regulator [Gemmatimonadales bacterium]|nr:MarR family transcriptional regulator [Gemmatimonadales bacterium]
MNPPRRANRRASPTSPDKQRDTIAIVQGLRRMVKALHTYSQDVRNTYGLTGPQLWALKTIERHRRLSIGRLAAALAIHQSSASILLNRLERRGLVRRTPGREDRRFVELELTQRGAVLATEAPEPAQGRLLHSLKAMPPSAVRRLRAAVDDLVGAMEASDVQARFFFTDE